MKTIYKYSIDPLFRTMLPEGAKVLSVGSQGSGMFLWALVDPNAPKVERTFDVYGTGHTVDYHDGMEFIGTVMMEGGALVFHVFENVGKV